MVDHLWSEKLKKIFPVRTYVGRYRYGLENGIFNNLAPLQYCGCQIK
jgi:hypothetical protein